MRSDQLGETIISIFSESASHQHIVYRDSVSFMQVDIEQRILDVLRQYQYGLTTAKVAELTGVSRSTVMRYLERLKSKGLVVDRKVGAYRVWTLKEVHERTSREITSMMLNAFILACKEVLPESLNKSEELGRAFVRTLFRLCPDEAREFLQIEADPVEALSIAVSYVAPNLTARGVQLDERRGVLLISGLRCVEDAVDLIRDFLRGAVIEALQRKTGRKVIVRTERTKARDDSYEIVFELEIQ